MADVLVSDWDATPANNTTIDNGSGGSIGIQGTNAVANFDDAVRSIMAAVAVAVGSMLSGSTRPTNVRANSFWVDTSGGATANVVTFYDGTDDIALFTINTTANSVDFDLIDGKTAETTIEIADELVFRDTSASADRKITFANLMKGVSNLSTFSTPALGDSLLVYDSSSAAAREGTLEEIFKVLDRFTEDASPDLAADFVPIFDSSAGELKKALPSNLISSPFSEGFESAGQAFTAGSTTTVAHGLGGAPTEIQIAYECISADLGYSIGDRIYAGPAWRGDSNQGHLCYADATNVNVIVYSGGLGFANKGTLAGGGADESKWEMYIYARR